MDFLRITHHENMNLDLIHYKNGTVLEIDNDYYIVHNMKLLPLTNFPLATLYKNGLLDKKLAYVPFNVKGLEVKVMDIEGDVVTKYLSQSSDYSINFNKKVTGLRNANKNGMVNKISLLGNKDVLPLDFDVFSDTTSKYWQVAIRDKNDSIWGLTMSTSEFFPQDGLYNVTLIPLHVKMNGEIKNAKIINKKTDIKRGIINHDNVLTFKGMDFNSVIETSTNKTEYKPIFEGVRFEIEIEYIM